MAQQDQFSFNLGLSTLPEFEQSKHPELWVELLRMRIALRTMQGALDLYTGALSEDQAYWNQTSPASSVRLQNISRVYAKALENISAGQLVSFTNSAGELGAQKANATDNTKPCRAFCYTPGGVTSGNYGEFMLMGIVPYLTGMTPGTAYYLSTTSGQYTTAAPSTVGNIAQEVGYALTSNTLYFNPVLNWKQI